MNKELFDSATYLSQVHRLKKLALEALKLYPIKVQQLKFIFHGENTTFQVIDMQKKKYLLRIHRYGYHTKEAIMEELSWLQYIARFTDIFAPEPSLSHENCLLIKATHSSVGHDRYCSLLKWVDGRFVEKSVNVNHMKKLGNLIYKLQVSGKKQKIRHRNYWSIDGLIGKTAKFGDFANIELEKALKKDLLQGRKYIYKKLKKFEIDNPKSIGLIHADLHFHNFLFHKGNPVPIDFDDCGLGLYHYDLAIPLIALLHYSETHKNIDFVRLQNAFLEEYSRHTTFTEKDIALIPYFIAARKFSMISWLHSRSDLENLKKRILPAAKSVVRYIQKSLH